MEPPPQSSRDAAADAAAGSLSPGVDEEREEAHEAQPAESSAPGEGGEEQPAQCDPEQGAAAEGKEAGDEGEGKEGGDAGAAAAGPADGGSREAVAEVAAEAGAEEVDEAGASGGEGGEQGGEQQPPEAAVEALVVVPRRVPGAAFTPLQVQELEGIFQHTPYLSPHVRQDLARRMGVTEAQLKVWFKNRRAKWRRHQRALRLRSERPVLLASPVVAGLGGPCGDMLFREQHCMCVPVEPLPLGPFLGPPVPPVPALQPLPPVPPVPPLPALQPLPPVPPLPALQPLPPLPPLPALQPLPPLPPLPALQPLPPVSPGPPMPPVPPVQPFPPFPPFPPEFLPPVSWRFPPLRPCGCPQGGGLVPSHRCCFCSPSVLRNGLCDRGFQNASEPDSPSACLPARNSSPDAC
ncbi:uncharacterized protein LOC141576394 [Camelus bactrianus]|uniref:Uncharacterized protein LOC141576394 n=1 Tax=Camelus bactrianus TaxID=9837 RepID=A0AC58Q011_CAMBA